MEANKAKAGIRLKGWRGESKGKKRETERKMGGSR